MVVVNLILILFTRYLRFKHNIISYLIVEQKEDDLHEQHAKAGPKSSTDYLPPLKVNNKIN